MIQKDYFFFLAQVSHNLLILSQNALFLFLFLLYYLYRYRVHYLEYYFPSCFVNFV